MMMTFAVSACLMSLFFLIRGINSRSYTPVYLNFLLFGSFCYLGFHFLPIKFSESWMLLWRQILVMTGGIYFLGWAMSEITGWFSKWKFFHFRYSAKLPEHLQEIVRALDQLASVRTGALVVLERKKTLDDYIRNAVQLDTDINKDIMISLFNTRSPLHDGALVIRKGRIRAARVILPLATAPDVPMGIGTRHRSAIGIAEKTDAISLVVSEERGQMSIAAQGKLVKAENAEEMSRLINAAYKGRTPFNRSRRA